MGTEGVAHWYCTPSQVLRVCLMSTAHTLYRVLQIILYQKKLEYSSELMLEKRDNKMDQI